MSVDPSTRWLYPGFTRDSVLNYLFKKGIQRIDTSLNNTYYQEPAGTNNLFLEYLATDEVPQNPPTDFVKLSTGEIATVFGIEESEVSEFNTTIDGVSAFSVEKSLSYPHILRINNLLMKPYVRNINGTFTGISSRTRVNLISSAIHAGFGSGGYKCHIKRSGLSGELSLKGSDILLPQHVAFIFDNNDGFLTLHQTDNNKYTPNPINYLNPPVFSCYVYRGNYGRIGWHVKNNALVFDETQLLVGKNTVSDPSLIMDVSGAAFITDITCQSIATFSDIRLKENIRISEINHKILELNPVYYNYKRAPGVKEFGLIAQEVEKVAPEIVKPCGEHLSVQYDRLGVYLIPIVRQQEERIKALEKQVELLLKVLSEKS